MLALLRVLLLVLVLLLPMLPCLVCALTATVNITTVITRLALAIAATIMALMLTRAMVTKASGNKSGTRSTMKHARCTIRAEPDDDYDAHSLAATLSGAIAQLHGRARNLKWILVVFWDKRGGEHCGAGGVNNGRHGSSARNPSARIHCLAPLHRTVCCAGQREDGAPPVAARGSRGTGTR